MPQLSEDSLRQALPAPLAALLISVHLYIFVSVCGFTRASHLSLMFSLLRQDDG